MTLEAGIAQLIELGEKDPLLIARKLEQQQGHEWITEQLSAYAEQLVAELARQRLGSLRRSAQIALRPGDVKAQGELKIRSFWVPNFGWKVAADLTSSDLIARAEWNEKFAAAVMRQSTWLREVAGLMVAEGVKTLGRLKAALPPLEDAPIGELT